MTFHLDIAARCGMSLLVVGCGVVVRYILIHGFQVQRGVRLRWSNRIVGSEYCSVLSEKRIRFGNMEVLRIASSVDHIPLYRTVVPLLFWLEMTTRIEAKHVVSGTT